MSACALKVRFIIALIPCLKTRAIGLVSLSILFLMGGCSTKPAIDDVILAYTTVRTVVYSNIPLGVRKESPNGREITSNYFSIRSLDEELGEDAANRAYEQVIILGSSRPYRIMIKVVREQRSKKSKLFVSVGEDKKLTKDLIARLRAALADRREDRNIIDDFRAF